MAWEWNMISINGISYRFVQFYDENMEETGDAAEACMVLCQRLDEVKPQGEEQMYVTFRAEKGTFQVVQ